MEFRGRNSFEGGRVVKPENPKFYLGSLTEILG
jgi:hypothetical protein